MVDKSQVVPAHVSGPNHAHVIPMGEKWLNSWFIPMSFDPNKRALTMWSTATARNMQDMRSEVAFRLMKVSSSVFSPQKPQFLCEARLFVFCYYQKLDYWLFVQFCLRWSPQFALVFGLFYGTFHLLVTRRPKGSLDNHLRMEVFFFEAGGHRT